MSSLEHPRLRRGAAVVAIALGALAGAAKATTVRPLTLAETVRHAESIQRVRVTRSRVAWGKHLGQRAIVTTLTLTTVEALRGRRVASLDLFGGTIGGRTLRLLGQPELKRGDEAVLFLEKDRQRLPSPFVGIWHGVYLLKDGQVFRQGRPLVDFAKGHAVFGKDNQRGLAPETFLALVRKLLPDERTTPARPPEGEVTTVVRRTLPVTWGFARAGDDRKVDLRRAPRRVSAESKQEEGR